MNSAVAQASVDTLGMKTHCAPESFATLLQFQSRSSYGPSCGSSRKQASNQFPPFLTRIELELLFLTWFITVQ